MINWAPTTCETGMLTLHASALIDFQNTVRYSWASSLILTDFLDYQADVSKVIEVREGAEGLTKEIIDAKLTGK